MSSLGCLDVILLALMLIYVFAVAIYVYSRYYLARPAQGLTRARARTLAAVLNIELGSLKSIAITAPYLGLVGTCEGILTALGGGAMEKHAFMAMIATRSALALVPIAAAIPVAVAAMCAYHFLRSRIELLEGGGFDGRLQRGQHFRGASRSTPTRRFAELPAFGLIAATALAFTVAAYMTLGSFHTPKGFYVELPSARCQYDVDGRLIVLHITGAGELFLNLERQDWNALAGTLSQVYSTREHHTLYLLADPGVPFQTVARALDIVETASAQSTRMDKIHIEVRLVTPKLFNTSCVRF